jgi:preprotein translocase subunit SecA
MAAGPPAAAINSQKSLPMGLFDWLLRSLTQRSAPSRAPSHIWLTEAAMRRALIDELGQAAAAGPRVLLVAHFPGRRQEIAAALHAAGVDCEMIEGRFDGHAAGRWISPAGFLLSDQIDVHDWHTEQARFTEDLLVIAVERHPVRERDEAVDVLGRGWSRGTRVQSFLSLDDPLMKRFAGQWVRQVLETLGMDESEAIESDLVRRRLDAALRQIERQTFGHEEADSLDEWLERNCPDLANSRF